MKLYDLVGDDGLFDALYRIEQENDPNVDIRYVVANKLQEWLNNLDSFFKPWDNDSIAICRKLVEEHATIKD
ncbi:hypothetical protein [Teredinibacter sp. KSP-S5-2]|uniref:hypothetical protein n=1 Tax=Teredinibacter sp. KSP-S5-2 TaxID=3034506 RepID=UPI0029345BA7|nr:hypothetical protein [Teredinibacter sp. KSP-S5-2]WNO10406.1 hypothetical protein P5V12_04405 [Teredinibacter sp. KSP-S5-2]